ncbi:LTA synthase family protein [Orbaceae bacterium ac157xtp]
MNKIIKICKNLYAFIIIVAGLIICSSSVGFSTFTLIAFGFYLSLYLLLLAISRKQTFSLVITSSIIILIQLINQIKVHFYKERLFFSDFYVACDINNLSTLLHYPLALFYLVCLFAFIIINALLFRKGKKIKNKTRLWALLFSLLTFVIIIYLSGQKDLNKRWQSYLPKGRGTISNLLVSAHQLSYEPPFYETSSDYFLQKMSAITADLPQTKQQQKPDIVVFLQESTFNPQLFNFESNHLPNFEMFKQNNSNLMRVQTYGGGTWLSEFSMLTGLNSDDFQSRKNSVFYVVAPHIKTSLFNELNNNGYNTIVFSPMQFGNYNAGPAYTALGMQQFLTPQDLGYPAEKTKNLWKIPSEHLLKQVKELLETKSDKPRFIFVLSMFEHGPYSQDTPDHYNLAQDVNDGHFVGQLNDYLAKLQPLNKATLDFINYINERNNPTLFLYFGDHQPAVSWNGNYKTDLPNGYYLTQYTLASNYPINIEKNEVTDISLVGSLVLEKAGVNYSDFYKANIAMRYLCNGMLDDCKDEKLVSSYKHYIYQDLGIAGETQ